MQMQHLGSAVRSSRFRPARASSGSARRSRFPAAIWAPASLPSAFRNRGAPQAH